MKKYKLTAALAGLGLSLAGLTQSCVSDAPFLDGEGEGTLRMKLVVNSDLTRAQAPTDALADSCVVYISGSKGLLHAFKGIDNIPEEGIRLKAGHYVAEAWTGDSVTASWDARFYRGWQPFEIGDQSENSVVVTCRIANVVVSMDKESVMPELGDDWKLTVSNSRGELTFTKDNMESAKAFFMMPNADIAVDDEGNYIPDDPGFTKYTNLKYRIEGTNAAGKHFEKSGDIGADGGNLVQHAHEYRLSLRYNPEYEAQGGSFITIVVKDVEVEIESEVGIYSKPAIKGATFDLERQIRGGVNQFADDAVVKVSAFNGISAFELIPEDGQSLGVIPAMGINLKGAIDSRLEELKAAGLAWDEQPAKHDANLVTSYLTLGKAFLNSLAERENEYRLRIHVVDGNGRENSAVVRIAVGEAAVVQEFVALEAVDSESSPLSILATSAVLKGSFDPEAVNPQVQYRKDGDPGWTSVNLPATRASEGFSVTITGLQPATKYFYRGAAEGWTGEELSFTTEAKFVIPYANMETWNIAKGDDAIKFPGTSYDEPDQFWDSGNHGSALMSTSLTQSSTLFHQSGSQSAELKSQKVGILGGLIGKFAAGNLFVGRFGETIDTDGAMLTFGKPYNGSHPSALQVYVNYTPVKVTAGGSQLSTSDMDQGQIYVALTTGPIQVNTGKKDSNGVKAGTFMDFNDSRILGFGEKTWKDGERAGDGSSMEKVTIPIKWRQGAKTKKPTHIIIVCSASKFGDYFVGGAGSVMYLDDFELIYDELTFE